MQKLRNGNLGVIGGLWRVSTSSSTVAYSFRLTCYMKEIKERGSDVVC